MLDRVYSAISRRYQFHLCFCIQSPSVTFKRQPPFSNPNNLSESNRENRHPRSLPTSMSSLSQAVGAGNSPLERLPEELLRKILIFAALNRSDREGVLGSNQGTTTNPTGIERSRLTPATTEYKISSKIAQPATSLPCILTSRALHVTALPVMYRDITTSLPSTFTKFLAQLRCHQSLGKYIRSLDLSPVFTHSRSPHPENEALANPIPGLLHLTPLLLEFKIGPSIQEHLDRTVLRQLFCELPHIQFIDLSNCNGPSFIWEFTKLCAEPGFRASSSITSLNLHGCKDLPCSVFEAILPQLPKLQIFDVANTHITPSALNSIPLTAKLTHVDLENCDMLLGLEVVNFFRTHPSVTATLQSLNLNASSPEKTYLTEGHVTSILSKTPLSLQTLHLKNSSMTSIHIPLLRHLTGQLGEMTVGSNISMRDLEAIFLNYDESEDDESSIGEMEIGETEMRTESKYQTLLDPLAEAVAICNLRRRINSTSSSESESVTSKLRVLDISTIDITEQQKIRLSVLLGPQSGLLETIVVGQKLMSSCGMLKRICRAVGWDVKRFGERCWIRRN
jgi:hypothetical protein